MRKLKYFLLGVAISFVIGALCFDQSFPSIDPSIWRVYAEATGFWPSSAVTPVLWRKLVALGCEPTLISVCAVGLLAFAVFDVLWRLLVLMVCPQDDFHNWWRMTVPALALLGSLLAVFSEPVWRLALSGSPAVLTVALIVLSFDLFLLSFFAKIMLDEDGLPEASIRPNLGVYSAILLSGVVTVETPFGLLLPVLFAVVHRLLLPRIMDGRYQDHPEDLLVFAPLRFSNWAAFFLWLAGVVVTVLISDISKDGAGLLRYLVEVLRGLQSAASPIGWILLTGCAFVPFALSCGLLPVLTAPGRRLEFALGIVSLLVGVVSLVVVSPAARGDWAIVPFAVVRAPVLQTLGGVLSAQAAALSLALFAYYAFHVMPVDYAPRKLIVFGVGSALTVATVIALAGIRRGPARQVRQAIADAMEETVREAKGLSWIFTDGSADVGLELVAHRCHQDLHARPLITGGALAASENAATLLRDWLAENSSNLQASAVQIGFDLWKRERRPLPVASGLLARYDWPAGACSRGIDYAAQLGDRMVELSRSGAVDLDADERVRTVFSTVLWRLSRMAAQRGDAARAEALEEANGAVVAVRERIERERAAAFQQLTDAEGLQLALRRADFGEARRYATSVLKRMPDDVSANFGMGMSFLLDKKPKEAILYLERAHKAKPTEPAILNNLAIAYLQIGDLAAAEAWAKKAIERAPDVPEVKDTFRRIEEAKRK